MCAPALYSHPLSTYFSPSKCCTRSVFRLHCASSIAWDGGESCLVISVMITINRNQARVGPKEKNVDAEMQEALVITGWQDLAIITHY